MRLTPQEVCAIKAAAAETFGPGAVVRLFGSRIDDSLRGGDIDLHIQLPEKIDAAEASALFRRSLDRHVGEREYDILIAVVGQLPSPVHERAVAEGIVL